MRLVLLTGPNARVPAWMRRRQANRLLPCLGLIAAVPPALVRIAYRPAAVEMAPYRGVRVGQTLGPHFADEPRIEAGEIAPVTVQPTKPTMQIPIAAAGDYRPGGIERSKLSHGLFVDIPVELLGMTLTQPGERLAPGRLVVHGVDDHGRVVEEQVHELFGLRQHGFAEE